MAQTKLDFAVRPSLQGVGVALALLMMPVAASAQTPAGAQTFMSRVAEQGGLKMWRSWPGTTNGFVGGSYGRDCSYGCVETHWLPVGVRTARGEGECGTTLIHAPPQGYPFGGGLAWTPNYQIESVKIDWSKITLVSIADSEPTRVLLTGTMPDGIDAPSFVLDTPELATRVRTAMEVLRSSCDPLGSTGF
ncbi:MAG TPA: hypothetical protein VGR32_03915 [Brevundimonas sp.]|jgi:hypothetical protein|uniref:hypothetical protein n=1 Tax=Brevundimonas sp. TaxID=1871086 RepID=UPI002DF1A01C|nr:hypothetical protein [Brevundimonas sp.]